MTERPDAGAEAHDPEDPERPERPRGLYAGAPDSLEPPTGVRGVRPPTLAFLTLLLLCCVAAIIFYLRKGV